MLILFCGNFYGNFFNDKDYILPAYADNGIISITYRGAGGYYIGNSVAFDGKNTVGNMTVIKITGPGLPAEGAVGKRG